MSTRHLPPGPSHAADLGESSALETLSRHGRTFRLAGYLLPRRQLAHSAALYAFCRHVDDLADHATDLAAARDALLDLRRAVLAPACGTPQPPALVGLRGLLHSDGLDPRLAARLIDTMIGDLGPVRIADPDALLRYAYGAAGTVGLMMCRLLGARSADAGAHALDLGVAMQLTNIARDVAEDLRRDRIYLPAQWLAPGAPQDPAATFDAVARLLALAERYYASGQRGLGYLELRPRLAIGAAAAVYREIGRRILRTGPAYLAAPRIVVPQSRRLLVLASSLPRSFARRPPGPHEEHLHAALAGEIGAEAAIGGSEARL